MEWVHRAAATRQAYQRWAMLRAMDARQSLVHALGIVACLTVLAGLVVRGRVRRVSFFTLFLALVGTYNFVVLLHPGLIVWRVWLVKQLLLNLLVMLTAAEIGVQLFAARAGARPRAGRAVLGAMAATAAFLALDLPQPDTGPLAHTSAAELAAFRHALDWLPRLAYGTAWLFAALWGTSWRFAIPLDPLREAVLLGFAVFSILQAVSLGLLNGPRYARLTSDVLTLAFLALLVVWAWFAWRHEPPPDAPEGVVRQVWPQWKP